ncbi:MAG: sensor domain-containing diguanylate cyclase [Candidatus Velthaea sp.]
MIDLTRWESTRGQRRAALLSVAALALVAIALTPVAHIALRPELTAVAAILAASICANGVTAFLLFSQFRTTRSPGIAILALGYGFSAFAMTAYFLTEQEMFGAVPPFGTTVNSAPWLWVIWHAGFLALLLTYVVVHRRSERAGSERRIGLMVTRIYRVAVPGAVAVVAVALFARNLPAIDVDGEWTLFALTLAPATLILSALVLYIVWRATGLRSMLDLWLTVAVSATICDMYLTLVGYARFSLGWYGSRVEVFISAFAVLGILVYQIDRMYGALARTASHLDEQAHVDGLTGIPNRRRFDEYSARVVATAQRRNAPLSILMIDIDWFKAYNDSFGHLAGDDCLRHIARLIHAQVPRPGDLVARYGGEEFVVMLVDTDALGAITVGERVRSSIEGARIPHAPSTGRPFVTVSIGACELRVGGDTLAGMIGAADGALYRAKADGRNNVEVATRTLTT